jgi:maleylpyruvate isomerase
LSVVVSLDDARAQLRARQGLGARYDASNAPARELDWARRGTAYFSRKLNELTDDALWQPSRVPGWSRRHVAACVGYHARALTRITEAARTGSRLAMFDTPTQRDEEIEDGATLPAGALRHLVVHAQVHLNVEWRDLSNDDWERRLSGDGPSRARDTAWLRAKEIWLRAVDLGNGGAFRDFPQEFLSAVLTEKLGHEPGERDLHGIAQVVLGPMRSPY